MNLMKKSLCALALAFASMSASAAALPFTITGSSFQLGAGYGKTTGTADNSLLDVVFATAPVPPTFVLNDGETFSFDFATVNFREVCIGPGGGCASGNETLNLGLTANLEFLDPVIGTVQSMAVGNALPGPVSDTGLDYWIDFAPVLVEFGRGGSFMVDLSDLRFARNETQTMRATITLVTSESHQLPEPGSLALLGLGLAGVGALVRRKAA